MQFSKITFLVSLLCAAGSVLADVTPTIVARSQGRNAVDKVAGLTEKVHLYDEGTYVNVDATVGYAQTFKANKIAKALFGADVSSCGRILVQGTLAPSRDANAWLADYFYLPPDYNSSFCIKPKIENFLADLQIYVGLDKVLRGLYFRAQGPINYSRWNMNFTEDCTITTTGSYRPGYFDYQEMSNAQLLGTFGDYISGGAPRGTSGANGQPGVQFDGLEYAKIESCARHRTGFADLRMELGYNFLQSDKGHLGLNVQVVAPTGSHREAEYAFDAVIGNGNHWEVGGGLSAHYIFWTAQTQDKYAGIYLDANLTHMNNAREQRTFDLVGRPNSRYMLAEKLGRPVSGLEASASNPAVSPKVPVAQFQGEFAPVANLTTLDVNVASAVQADIVVMFNYTTHNWRFDLGYNLWARSSEKISLDRSPGANCCPNLCKDDIDTWALKGDAQVYGFTAGGIATNAFPLSATECGSTIHAGTNATAVDATLNNPALQNGGVDNAEYAFNGSGTLLVYSPGLSGTANAVRTSFEPRFINCCDIDFKPTKGISNKVFGNINYTWEMDSWEPYFGLGASAEFGSLSNEDCTTVAPDCTTSCSNVSTCCGNSDEDCAGALKFAISQWQFWLKGGLNFH